MIVITLLTQPDCGSCDHAKQVLDEVGRDYPLRVEEIPLDSAAGRRLAAAGGVLFAPGIFVDGQPFGFGRLSQRRLRRHLARRSHHQAEPTG